MNEERQTNTDMLLGNSVSDLKKDNEFLRAVQGLYNGKNKHIDMVTQLQPQEIMNIARVRVLQEWADHKLPIADVFIESFMRMKVSESRKGRLEFFEAFKPVLAGLTQPTQPQGFLGKLFSPRAP